MPIAYFDCPTGIAGDMCLGALVSAGVPLSYLADRLRSLGIADEYHLGAVSVQQQGQQATQVQVTLRHPPDMTPIAATEGHPDGPSQIMPPDTSAGAVRDASDHSHPHPPHPHPPDPDEILARNPAVPGHTHHHNPDRAPNHEHDHSHAQSVRHLPEIAALIQQAALPPRVEAWSLAVFRQLAIAEGAVHGIPPEQVHFHEVGATDAIVDIVGTCLGLDWLGIDSDADGWPLLYCSALPTGGGTVWAAHGRLPVPVPAVLKLWEMRQVPIYSNGIERELVTPTGAAIVTTLARQFGPPPAMILEKVGLGAGTIALPMPNLLRLWIGRTREVHPSPASLHPWAAGQASGPDGGAIQDHGADQGTEEPHQDSDRPPVSAPQASSLSPHAVKPVPALTAQSLPPHSRTETIAVLETQIDDLTPQAIAYVGERLYAIGALEVFTQPIGMKKNRAGILLTVICYPDRRLDCEEVLFRETTTLGVRHTMQQRSALGREVQTVQTIYGPVRLKLAWFNPQTVNPAPQLVNVQPEYEDCAQLARQHQVPWREVHRVALAAWHQHPEMEVSLSPTTPEEA